LSLSCNRNSNFIKLRISLSNVTDLALGLVQLAKPIESLVGDIDPCLIGLNGAEWEVVRRNWQFREVLTCQRLVIQP